MPQNQLSERDMLQDSISTEKHVSSAYNTTITESVNQKIIKALQDIQQEEQNHSQLFFEMMHKKGWYPVQASHPNQKAQQEVSSMITIQFDNRLHELEQTNQKNS